MSHRLRKLFLLLATAAHIGAAASCTTEIGPERAGELVRQCLKVAPALRPACGAANNCQKIEQTIQRGCEQYSRPAPFCYSEARKGTHEGYLVAGRAVDYPVLTIRSDDGQRFMAFCGRPCGDWFEESADPEVEQVKPAYLGRRVSFTVRPERNEGRLPGADPDDQLMFVQSIRFLK